MDAVAVDILLERGRTIRGISQDIGPGGMFVRTPVPLRIGTPVELLIYLIEPPLRVAARVAHTMSAEEARALGRMPGLGFAYDDLGGDIRLLLETHIAKVREAQAVASPPHSRPMRIVIADGETRLLERMSTALGNAGWEVVMASNGVEAFSACLASPPDVVVAELHLPVVDGPRLMNDLGARPDLAEVPVLMMSEDAGDLRRLEAYQLGVADFLPKPFTVAELCIRVHRLASAYREKARRVVLRGELSKMSLPVLLNLFDHEQKTGVVAVSRQEDAAWISLRSGRPVKARALASDLGSVETMYEVLSWNEGHFEFTACDVDDDDEIGMPITHLLLEHARLTDERRRQA